MDDETDFDATHGTDLSVWEKLDGPKSPEEVWDQAIAWSAHKLQALMGNVERLDGSEISYAALLGSFNPHRSSGIYSDSTETEIKDV